MSAVRDAIVAALGDVAGVASHPVPPSVIQAGAAWPVWASSTWQTACLTVDTWYAFYALPSGAQGATVDASDSIVGDIATALWAVGKVDRVEPWSWPVDQTQAAVPVLRFSLSMSGGI